MTENENENKTESTGIITIAELAAILAGTRGKLLAVDFGDKRTGLAVSDDTRFIASGIGTISPGGIAATVAETARVISREGAVAAVVGLPRNMDGSEGARADRCREFALLLSGEADIPVVMLDERLTTVAASRYLNETNTRGKKRKGVIDTLSAEIILQNALDRLKNITV